MTETEISTFTDLSQVYMYEPIDEACESCGQVGGVCLVTHKDSHRMYQSKKCQLCKSETQIEPYIFEPECDE